MNTTDMHMPSNKVRDIERYFLTELASLYPEMEIKSFVGLLFEAFLGWDKVRLMTSRNETINQSDLLKFHWAAEDLKKNRPIQYIIGSTEFCGLQLSVREGVLVPRPETEEIVYRVADLAKQQGLGNGAKVLDVCTGSGCIALALEHLLPGCESYGVDVSAEALSIARANAERLELRTKFVECDILCAEPQIPVGQFDIIVSNPPYVRDLEKLAMNANVLDHEPHIALFVPDDDPLVFYRAIGKYAFGHLTEKGFLTFEINEYLGPETCELLQDIGFVTELYKDFYGKDRCIIAYKK